MWRDGLALTPQNGDAFFREVDDEVRRDRLTGLGRRYGRQAAVAVLMALVALATWLFWQHRRDETAGAAGVALAQALNDASGTNPAAAGPQLAALAASGDTGYAVAARIAAAGLMASKGDIKGAAAAFGRIALDGTAPQPFRDLALVRQTALEYDAIPARTVVSRMTPFAAAGNPWFGSAGEMAGLAYLKQGKPAKAGRLFAALAKDQQVPDTIRARAVRIAGMLGIDVGTGQEGMTVQ